MNRPQNNTNHSYQPTFWGKLSIIEALAPLNEHFINKHNKSPHQLDILLIIINHFQGKEAPAHQHLCKNYICAASRNTRDRIMLIRAKHRTIV